MHTKATAAQLNEVSKGNLGETLGIEILALGKDFIEAKMPVDHRTTNPLGILHGGASAALAETIGSFGSYLLIDHSKERMVGLNVTSNHIKSVSSGFVYAKAVIVHKGRSTHLWNITIKNEAEQVINYSTLSVAILPSRSQ